MHSVVARSHRSPTGSPAARLPAAFTAIDIHQVCKSQDMLRSNTALKGRPALSDCSLSTCLARQHFAVVRSSFGLVKQCERRS